MILQNLRFNNDWDKTLEAEFDKPYFIRLLSRVKEEYDLYSVYPDKEDIFNAFKLTPYSSVKAVLLGQDPYINPGQAEGLAFSVREGCPPPPSLRNILKELGSDLEISVKSNNLRAWAERGVLLLNSVLTVRCGEPDSHKGIGWEIFTDNVIRALSDRKEPLVFILWGKKARMKKPLIAPRHCIIESAHPSPLSASRGFFNSRPFSKANEFLGLNAIDWRLP
ncbi:MAG: uracil-DNA glycosylase [Christensenellales bacterium]|jgi:uracil-DNA glycosylase